VDWTRWNRWRYTALAPGYDAVVGEFAKARRRSIDGLELSSGDKVLLVGAGTGLDLEFFPPGARLTANDSNSRTRASMPSWRTWSWR
jgi:phosphatidylethanolamine/phosphatidyl-N-methylethanolamine N-methyltransferase